MKILIFGGRDFSSIPVSTILLDKAFQRFKLPFSDKEGVSFIHGAAGGADTTLNLVVRFNGFESKAVPALWDDLDAKPCRIKYNRFGKPYNALAGMNRNTIMVNECDIAIGVWDGMSTGTADSKYKLRAAQKPTLMFDYDGNLIEEFYL